MAKKQPRPSRPSRPAGGSPATRKKKISLETLERAVKLLGQQSDGLSGLAAQMQEHGLDQVEIDGYGLLVRGIDTLDRFLDNVDAGIKKARRRKGRPSL